MEPTQADDQETAPAIDLAGDTLPENVLADDDCSGLTLISLEQQFMSCIERRIQLPDEKRWFLANLFDASHYQSVASLSFDDPVELICHYLDSGMAVNTNPSLYFDTNYVKEQLALSNNCNAMLAWLERGFDSLAGVSWFDDDFYRDTYPDIDQSVTSGYLHFVANGRFENRHPCQTTLLLFNARLSHFGKAGCTLMDFLQSVEATHIRKLLEDDTLSELLAAFHSDYYRGSIKAEESTPPYALLAHYLTSGWAEGKRPSPLFHPDWYEEQVSAEVESEQIGVHNPWLHWMYTGRPAHIIPTPLFDLAHYIELNPDAVGYADGKPFEHYVERAFIEHGRSASVYFDSNIYRANAGVMLDDSPLVDYLLRGQFLNIAHVNGFNASTLIPANTDTSSPAEELAIQAHRKLDRLKDTVIADIVRAIEEQEPQIARPYGKRKVRMAPEFHPEASLTLEARNIRQHLPKEQYDTIVLIPHCRMAGSAKVSGAMVNALSNVTDHSSILIVMTDMSVMERADWFPPAVDVFDFNQHTHQAPQERRCRALMDMVRGLRPKRLININSNLGWHLTKHYGRQLSEWMHLYCYLFCWDVDRKGNKGGYPIQWFLPTFDYCSGVFTDESSLREELVGRYAPSKALASRIVTLYEPATDLDINYRQAFVQRAAHGGTRRVFWCGRFDRQKRLDLLVAIAQALPDVEFYVYGKPVLADGPDYLDDAPENIRLMGHYSCIDDVPIASSDCFLYTSAWDGMPSVLIEMASRNIPIVASNVGGVAELINADMGWLVDDADNVNAYVEALEELLQNPEDALNRATRLREHTLTLCTQERYENSIRQVIEKEIPRGADSHEIYVERPLPNICSHEPAGSTVDITAVLTAHGEGALAAVTYRNFENACCHAEEQGLSVERIIMLDKANRATRIVFEDMPDTVRLVRTAHGDQGAVRNEAVQIANGTFVAFIDGDDLWCGNWLADACRFLKAAPQNTIAHPELCWFFGGVSSLFFNIDQEDPRFQMDFLRHANYWDAMCMARRDTHLAFPYCKRRINDGFAFEDWHWNCETIDGGLVHKIVPDTLHFKRRRETSQTTKASDNRSLMPATRLTQFHDVAAAKLKTAPGPASYQIADISL